jgi:hypothetical protein
MIRLGYGESGPELVVVELSIRAVWLSYRSGLASDSDVVPGAGETDGKPEAFQAFANIAVISDACHNVPITSACYLCNTDLKTA